MLERLLVVGLGSIGTRHIRLARSLLPELRIVVLRHQLVAAQEVPGVERCVGTMAEALAFRPQAAVIANPASHHLEVARVLAENGVHLLIEKPISDSAAGVADLLAIGRARGLTVMTAYNLRFMPSLRRFRELLHDDVVGKILSVRVEAGQYLPTWRPGSDYRTGVSARRDLGGGVLLELSHEVDYLRWIFGEIAWVKATCVRRSSLEIDVEDTAFLTLAFAGGQGTEQLVASVVLDFVRHDTTRQCTVVGERGTLRWNAVAGTVEQFAAGGKAWTELFRHVAQRDETYLVEWDHFLRCLADGTPPPIGAADGLAVLRVVDAARQAAASGAVVPVAGA